MASLTFRSMVYRLHKRIETSFRIQLRSESQKIPVCVLGTSAKKRFEMQISSPFDVTGSTRSCAVCLSLCSSKSTFSSNLVESWWNKVQQNFHQSYLHSFNDIHTYIHIVCCAITGVERGLRFHETPPISPGGFFRITTLGLLTSSVIFVQTSSFWISPAIQMTCLESVLWKFL